MSYRCRELLNTPGVKQISSITAEFASEGGLGSHMLAGLARVMRAVGRGDLDVNQGQERVPPR